MKLLLVIIFIIVIFINSMRINPIEGLCGSYSLTYSKIKDIFKTSDASGISMAYNTNYNKDLLLDCYTL